MPEPLLAFVTLLINPIVATQDAFQQERATSSSIYKLTIAILLFMQKDELPCLINKTHFLIVHG